MPTEEFFKLYGCVNNKLFRDKADKAIELKKSMR